ELLRIARWGAGKSPWRDRPPVDLAPYRARVYAFTGKTGYTEERVLQAVFSLAETHRRVDHLALSERDMALLAGIGRDTARRALRRIEKRGTFIERQRVPGLRANAYRLLLPVHESPQSPAGGGGAEGTQSLPEEEDAALGGLCTPPHDLTPSHDLWRRLGPATAKVYAQLGSRSQSAKALYRALRGGRPPHPSLRTVKGAGHRPAAQGLAVHRPEGWGRGDADLTQVAERLGVLGRTERDRRQYEHERKQDRKRQGRRTT